VYGGNTSREGGVGREGGCGGGSGSGRNRMLKILVMEE